MVMKVYLVLKNKPLDNFVHFFFFLFDSNFILVSKYSNIFTYSFWLNFELYIYIGPTYVCVSACVAWILYTRQLDGNMFYSW